ncbi:outer membrane protein [Methylobacterium persicinum]|uniref:Outer membrane immunogenic protein n=1 Tax=Methylobacterium persicinum TaxID=374426 RepID=A0ABU0HPH0_9HYPH|nr:porin family protein [Methylobacterium persicinum]MDQ0444214.1 outer membrane immunogenic protein [Methylobacterium persicinum]
MKSLVTSLAMFTALTAAATAADLPRRAPPPVFTPVPVFTWTGFYAGFNAGYGFDASSSSTPTVIGVSPQNNLFAAGNVPTTGVIAFSNTRNNEGFVGGGQIGYNYQFTPGSGVVVGIEADAQYVDFGAQRNRFSFAAPAGSTLVPGALVYNPNGLSGLDYFGTVRGRLGYAFDRTLVYATGGFAYGSGGGRQFGTGVSSNDFQTGYAVGGGIEYALPTDSFLNFFRSSAVTLKVEGLYVNLDQSRNNAGAFANNNFGTQISTTTPGVTLVSGPANLRRNTTEFAVVRAGVNYKFGTY